MKNLKLSLLVIIGMMVANISGAQVSTDMLDMTMANWPAAFKQNAKTVTELKKALTSSDVRTQHRVIEKYAVNEEMSFSEVNFLHPTTIQATQLERLSAKDTTVTVMSVKLDVLTGDVSFKGQTVPLFAYAPERNTQPYFIMSYTPAQGAVASNEESEPVSVFGSKAVVQQEQTQIQEVPVGSVRVAADGREYTYMGKDDSGFPAWVPFGQTVVASSTSTENQESTERTATYQMSVSQSGDPNLLASAGNVGKNQHTQSGNGVERYQIDGRWYYNDPVTGIPTPIQGQPKTVTMKPNQVLLNGDGDVVMQERSREKQKVHRLYDLQMDAPTSGSARAVEARSDWVTGGRGTTVVVGGGYYPYGAVYQPVVKKYHGFQYTRKKCW